MQSGRVFTNVNSALRSVVSNVSTGNVEECLVVVSRFVSWNPQGSSPVCSVDGLPGMTEQSGKRLESVPSPFS